MSQPLLIAVSLAGAWGAWALLVHALARVSPRAGDPLAGAARVGTRVYARLVHRLRVEGLEHVPCRRDAGPLIVVANHTSGVDPLLVQAHCPFFVRWLMAEDMGHPSVGALWRWAEVIFVDRREGRGSGVREAIAHVRAGGVLGVFPEGRIESPARRLLPFEPGIGLLIARTGAPVLPVLIEGAPDTDSAWEALWTRSRARVRFLPVASFASGERGGRGIARALERVFEEASGWSLEGREQASASA